MCKYPSQVYGWKNASGAGVGKLERHKVKERCERHELPRITQDVGKVKRWGNNENESILVPW